jgi:hypothetical protein
VTTHSRVAVRCRKRHRRGTSFGLPGSACARYQKRPARSCPRPVCARRPGQNRRPTRSDEAARAELTEANAEAAIRKVVDAWPPLTAEVKNKLACLLLSGGDSNAAT